MRAGLIGAAGFGAKWLALGGLMGVLTGMAAAFFLFCLDVVTRTFQQVPVLFYFLPLAGMGLGWLYAHYAGPAARGSHLVMEALNNPHQEIPVRLATLVLFGTLITHLFGGSAGREGTAVQMGAGIASALYQRLGLGTRDRNNLLMAGVSGGFGAVFGTPFAGMAFGVEVASGGRLRIGGLMPCVLAAITGDYVTRLLGIEHAHYAVQATTPLLWSLVIGVVLTAVACGLVSRLFVWTTTSIKRIAAELPYVWTRPAIGALVLIGFTLLVGNRDYLGLGLPIIKASLGGAAMDPFAFFFKLIATSITVGSGFIGGEVTPLFAIGSSLGATMCSIVQLDQGFAARLGFVGMFAGASKAPITCVLMGMELFGGGAVIYLLIMCIVATLVSGKHSIYGDWPAASR